MSAEIWEDIPNYEGLYQVSNLGNVKSLERWLYKGHHTLEKILKPVKFKNGYYYVILCKDKKTNKIPIHKLVAITFLNNNNNLPCINHIDGNKLNNNVNNLEFCSYSYNNKEAYRLGLKKTIKTNQYELNGKFIKTFNSRADVKKQLGISEASIYKVCKGERKTAGGYIWRYVDE